MEQKVVIIGLSGNQSYREEAMEAEMDEFLIKPTAPHKVLQIMRDFCQLRKEAQKSAKEKSQGC